MYDQFDNSYKTETFEKFAKDLTNSNKNYFKNINSLNDKCIIIINKCNACEKDKANIKKINQIK